MSFALPYIFMALMAAVLFVLSLFTGSPGMVISAASLLGGLLAVISMFIRVRKGTPVSKLNPAVAVFILFGGLGLACTVSALVHYTS